MFNLNFEFKASASEGEIKINGVYQRALNRQASNGNTNNGKASYSRHLSDGEIGMRASVNGVSEGEVEQGENRRLPFSRKLIKSFLFRIIFY